MTPKQQTDRLFMAFFLDFTQAKLDESTSLASIRSWIENWTETKFNQDMVGAMSYAMSFILLKFLKDSLEMLQPGRAWAGKRKDWARHWMLENLSEGKIETWMPPMREEEGISLSTNLPPYFLDRTEHMNTPESSS